MELVIVVVARISVGVLRFARARPIKHVTAFSFSLIVVWRQLEVIGRHHGKGRH